MISVAAVLRCPHVNHNAPPSTGHQEPQQGPEGERASVPLERPSVGEVSSSAAADLHQQQQSVV
jgi:hypothetical protein